MNRYKGDEHMEKSEEKKEEQDKEPDSEYSATNQDIGKATEIGKERIISSVFFDIDECVLESNFWPVLWKNKYVIVETFMFRPVLFLESLWELIKDVGAIEKWWIFYKQRGADTMARIAFEFMASKRLIPGTVKIIQQLSQRNHHLFYATNMGEMELEFQKSRFPSCFQYFQDGLSVKYLDRIVDMENDTEFDMEDNNNITPPQNKNKKSVNKMEHLNKHLHKRYMLSPTARTDQIRKPNPSYYQELLRINEIENCKNHKDIEKDNYEEKEEDTDKNDRDLYVFIDDVDANVQASKRNGFMGILFQTPEKLHTYLQSLHLL